MVNSVLTILRKWLLLTFDISVLDCFTKAFTSVKNIWEHFQYNLVLNKLKVYNFFSNKICS